MADIAFKPGVLVRKATATKKSVAGKKVVAGRKHRGEHQGAVKVAGQTAAVAGISGALLLALKAMVLVAPSVLPHGNGLDSLGRPIPSAGIAADQTAPTSIGSALNSAPAATTPSGSGSVSRVSSGGDTNVGGNTGGGTTTPVVGGKTGGTTSGSGNTAAGGTTAGAGTLSTVTTTLGNTVNSILPGVGTTVSQTVTPIVKAVDPTLNQVETTLKPVTSTVGQVVQGTGLGDTVNQLATGTGLKGTTDQLGLTSSGSSGTSSAGLLAPVTSVLGGL